jgi:ABC-type transport system substrate-binding protein
MKLSIVTLTYLGLLLIMGCSTKSSSKKYAVFAGDGDKKYLQIADADWNDGWSKNNVLIVHTIGEPGDLHPCNGTSEPRSLIFNYTQKFLMRLGLPDCKVMPDLAKDYPQISANGLEYTYELRPEAVWDNGAAITNADVLFTFKVLKSPLTNNPVYKSYLQNIVDLKVDPSNAKKFTIIMRQQYVQNIEMLTDYAILQQSHYDKNNLFNNYSIKLFDDTTKDYSKETALVKWSEQFNGPEYCKNVQNMTGAGPYKVIEWEAGQKIVLEKKQAYWASNTQKYFENAYPNKIIFKVNKDANAQLLEFKNQTIDVSGYMSAKNLLSLQADSLFNLNYNSQFIATFNFSYLGMNLKPAATNRLPLFTDVATRKAMAYLTPVDNIYALMTKGHYTRTNSMISPMKTSYNKTIPTINVDIAMATQLLKQAGWADTDNDGILDRMDNGKKVKFEFELSYINATTDWKDICMLLKEAYAKAGIVAIPISLDFNNFVAKNKAHDFDMIIGSWGGVSGADDLAQIWSTQSYTNHGSNYVGFGNAKTDAIIDSSRYTLDPTKREKFITQFQQMVFDEQPYIFLTCGNRRMIIHKRFGNNTFYIEKPNVALNNLKLLSGIAAVPVMQP